MARLYNHIDEELVCIDSMRHVLECKLGLAVGIPQRVDPGQDLQIFGYKLQMRTFLLK